MLQQTHRAWWCCLCATFWNEAFSNKFVNKWSPHSTGQTSPRLPNTPNKKVSNLSGKYWDGEWVDAWQLVDHMADTMCQWPVVAVLHALFWLFFQQVNLDSTGVCLTVWCMVYQKKHRLIGWDWLACGSVRLVWLSFTVDVSFIILLSALLTAVDIVAKYCLVPSTVVSIRMLITFLFILSYFVTTFYALMLESVVFFNIVESRPRDEIDHV